MPRYSADGARIVAAVFESGPPLDPDLRRRHAGARWRPWATAARPTTRRLRTPSHVVYLAADGPDRGFQVQLGDLATGAVRQVTRAPYLAFEPQMADGRLRFLNREGWNWTLDEQVVTAPAVTPATPPPIAVSPPLPPVEALAIERDEPYDPTDHLFRPQLQGVAATAVGRSALMGEVVLAGGDRLQFHRWSLDGLLQLNGGQSGYGLGAAYANRQLAPWTIIADGLALRYQDTRPAAPPLMSPTPLAPAPFVLTKTELQGNLTRRARRLRRARRAGLQRHRRQAAGRADGAGCAPPRRRPVPGRRVRGARGHAVHRRAQGRGRVSVDRRSFPARGTPPARR